MQIFTSYFARIRRLPNNIVPISIAIKTPAWFSGARYPALAPKGDFFSVWKNNHDNEEYLLHYEREVLAQLDMQTVISDLQSIAGKKDIALMCYEKPSDFCHRHRVARWFTDGGIPVVEWGVTDREGNIWEQKSLF